jgi:hypothetical protein
VTAAATRGDAGIRGTDGNAMRLLSGSGAASDDSMTMRCGQWAA